VNGAEDTIGRLSCKISCRISGCANRRVTKEVPAVARAANAVCTSDIVDTVVSPILMSQVPFMRDCHRGVLAAGVLGTITQDQSSIHVGEAEACGPVLSNVKPPKVKDFLKCLVV
jgi:hypothetical protein